MAGEIYSDKRLGKDAARDSLRPAIWLHAGTIFLSAFLLFQLQPILTKLILPWFGGAAAVWTISLAFYQLTYLLGNLYAHFLVRPLAPRFFARAHAFVLLSSLFLLPIVPNAFWQPRGSEEPAWRILALLAATVGVPFLLLSATSPLLQALYTRGHTDAKPYRLYALSNAGSLLALLSYPIIIEPLISTRHQARIWSIGYGLFVILCGAVVFRERSAALPETTSLAKDRPGVKLQLLWLALAATASALLLSVTHYISQNIAAVPLLWVVPLSLYLVSLILCFEHRRWYRRSLFLALLPLFLGGMGYALLPRFENVGPALQIPLFLGGLFICCMACHGEMAALKPRPEFLTLFYLMVSGGGAFGGLLASIVAPRVWRGFYELPVALGLCAVFVSIALYRSPASSPGKRRNSVPLAAFGLTALLLMLLVLVIRSQSREAPVMVRNFYGILRVNILPSGTTRPAVTQLRNGTIVHGEEILEPSLSDVPTTYYGQQSGVGIALRFARQHRNLRVGVIGLGVGTLARYGQTGDRYSFYEINPQDVDLAKNLFDFLARSEAQVEIIPGDARLSLERQTPQEFDVLVVDAFSGDAIPVHLLTREALQLYLRQLKPQGVLAIHVSNRFLDLPAVVQAGAQSVAARVVEVTSSGDEATAVYETTWMLLDQTSSPNPTVSGLLQSTISLPPGTSIEREDRIVRPWTDDYSNLIEILK